MRLQRSDWLAGRGADGIEISGFEPCRPLFGLDGREPALARLRDTP